MAQSPCYSGPNPIKDEERQVVWKWLKEQGGVDNGADFHAAANAVNTKFFSGMAKPEWIDDILSGRKTPFRQVANDLWKKQYNRRVVTQQAKEVRAIANMGPVAKVFRKLWAIPRTVAVAGHGIVFPITHAGDLVFRPASWGKLISGTLRTYRGALVPSRLGGGKAYTGQVLAAMERDPLFDTAVRGGLDAGAASHPSGLISRTYKGPAQRAWDMLTVLRFELWKKQMGKFVKPGMTEAEVNEIGGQLAKWANHATGSGKGPVSTLGGEVLFGPKLTQSKLNRLTTDVAQTANTFQKMARRQETTAGERAVAWTRLSGATQFLVTNLGFLAVNQGVLYALGQRDKVNYNNPFKADFFAYKGSGIAGYVPGMHTEIRALAKVLALAFMDRKEMQTQLRETSKFRAAGSIAGQYAMAKLTPSLQRPLELGFGQTWQGRPLSWSKDPGTPKYPRMSYGEYLGSIGPIPLEGPIGFVYDQIKKTGASALDATSIVKALIIFGIGVPGFHVHEDYPEATPTSSTGTQTLRQQLKSQGVAPVRPKTLKQQMRDASKVY